MSLAAQCDTPPQYRAIPFRDSIAEGGIAPMCLVSCGIVQVSLRYPFCGGGVSHLYFACSPRGKRSEKGEGVSHPSGHVETPKAPYLVGISAPQKKISPPPKKFPTHTLPAPDSPLPGRPPPRRTLIKKHLIFLTWRASPSGFAIIFLSPHWRPVQKEKKLIKSGTKTRGSLEGGFCDNLCPSWLWRSECQIYSRARYPWVFSVLSGVKLDSAETQS